MEGKSSKMTVDRLAEISQREFMAVRSEMGKRFDDVDSRLDGLDKKFDSLEKILLLMHEDLKSIKTDVATINFDYSELRVRVERLEKKAGLSK